MCPNTGIGPSRPVRSQSVNPSFPEPNSDTTSAEMYPQRTLTVQVLGVTARDTYW